MLAPLANERSPKIREAIDRDIDGILTIYNEVIATSTAVYATEAVTLAERSAWLGARRARGFPVLVAVEDDAVIGFASFGDWRAGWDGFRHTVEHSVHVRADRRGQGIGGTLIAALCTRACDLGMHVMLGGIDAANAGSIRLHERLGFEQVAHFRQVGRKFDRWLDLVFMQRILADADGIRCA